jgi:ATP-dependent DNA helicase RecQ
MKIRGLLARDIGTSAGDGDGDDFRSEEAGVAALARTAASERALREMVNYAESVECRRARILAHFGEGPGQGPRSCGSCDICVPSAASGEAATEVDLTQEVWKFLSCVSRTGERFGAGHVSDILVGSKNERVLGLGHSKLSTWGIGKEWSKAQWTDLARQLVRKGYLAKDGDFQVLSLTKRAWDSFRLREPVMAALPARGRDRSGRPWPERDKHDRDVARRGEAAPTGGQTGEAAALEARLRALRKRIAGDAGVPPYVVFADRTLHDLVALRPASVEALAGVFGLGSVKIARYGEAIVAAMVQ